MDLSVHSDHLTHLLGGAHKRSVVMRRALALARALRVFGVGRRIGTRGGILETMASHTHGRKYQVQLVQRVVAHLIR